MSDEAHALRSRANAGPVLQRAANRTATLVFLGIATLVAFVVRSFHLSSQILGGDELHVIDVLATTPLSRIVGTVGEYDFSIPLALLYGALSHFVPLDEMVLRIPMLLAGSLLPIAGWYAFRPLVAGWLALGVGWVLALHPFVVFYGRFVRPYGIVLLLLLLCFGLLVRALSRASDAGCARRMVLAAMLGALALWLNVPALFACCGIGLAALLVAIFHRGRGRYVAAVLGFGGLVVAGALALYFPALVGLSEHVLSGKAGNGTLDGETILRASRVLGGSEHLAVAATALGLALLGLVAALRDRRELAIWIGTPVAVVVGAIGVTRPQLLEFDLVLARYAFNALPFLAVLALLGCQAIASRAPAALRDRVVVGLLAVVIVGWSSFAFASLRSIYGVERAYAHHGTYQTYDFLRTDSGSAHATAVYSALADAPRILEWPPPAGFDQNFLHLAQEVHRRPIGLLIVDERPFRAPFLALDHCVAIEEVEAGALPRGTAIVLHRNPQFEALAVRTNREPRQVTTRNPQGFARLVERLTRALGPPANQDAFAVAFIVR